MKIVGIAGTNGAGKDTVGEILASRHGWLFVSVTEILREELARRGLPIERHHLRTLSAEWRRQFGRGVLIDKAFDVYNTQSKDHAGLAIASLRNPGEAEEVHRLGGKVIWVDAPPEVRYKRVISRLRSSEDKKSLKQFLREEKAEMEHSGDHHTLSLAGVKAKADIFIQNDGDNLEELVKKIEAAIL